MSKPENFTCGHGYLQGAGLPPCPRCVTPFHEAAAPAQPVPPSRIKCGMCGDTKIQNGVPCPQCILGTCEYNRIGTTCHDNPHPRYFNCINWKASSPAPVLTQPSAEFYVDDTPPGERYFIGKSLVSQAEFLRRRDAECTHKFDHHNLCKNCGAERPVLPVPPDERKIAERAYINSAFDYERDPIGSRDWTLFWKGWLNCLVRASSSAVAGRTQGDLEGELALRAAWQILASAFSYTDSRDAQQILGDKAAELLVELRRNRKLSGEMQQWEVKIVPLDSHFQTWLPAPFLLEIERVFNLLENINRERKNAQKQWPSEETIDWAMEVLLRVVPSTYLIGADINPFESEVHVTWDDDENGKSVVVFFPGPKQLKIYHELVEKDVVVEHKLVTTEDVADISERLQWFFQ